MPRYYITLPDTSKLASTGTFAFHSVGAQGLAGELQAALTGDGLFNKWLATQSEPDDVDPVLGSTDPAATVIGEQHDLHVDLVVNTTLRGEVLKHRLRLLAGPNWQLKDVTN